MAINTDTAQVTPDPIEGNPAFSTIPVEAPLSIDTTPVEQPLSIASSNVGVNPSDALALKRAYKAQIGLGRVLNKPTVDLADIIAKGGEAGMRQEAAASLDSVRAEARRRAVENLISQQGINANLEDIFTKGTSPLSPSVTDPSSVIEQAYAEQYVKQLDRSAANNPDTFWTQANLQVPEYVKQAKTVGTNFAAKVEYLKKYTDNLDDQVAQQPWLGATDVTYTGVGSEFGALPSGYKGTIPDIVKMGLPIPILGQLYSELKMRGNVDGVSALNGLGVGHNMEAQGQALFRQPWDKFKDTIDKIVANKDDNPTLYAAYLHGLLGQTTAEKFINDTFTYSMAGDVGIIAGSLYRLFSKGAKTAATTALKEDVLGAVKDTVASTKVEPATPAVMANAVGDVQEAAVQQAIPRIQQDIKGNANAFKQSTDALFTYLDQDAKAIDAGKGNLSQNLANKIVEAYTAAKAQFKAVLESVPRPERMPVNEFSPEQIRAFKDDVIATYPNEPVLNTSNFYRVPYGSGWAVDLMIGTPQGNLWSSYQQAQTYIRTKGLVDAYVGPETKMGLGWYIRRTVPIDETSNVARDSIINVKGGLSPESGVLRSKFSILRTREDTVSTNQRLNVKAATYPFAKIQEVIDKDRKYLQDIKDGVIRFDPVTGDPIPFTARVADALGGEITRRNAKKWDEFNHTLVYNQKQLDPTDLRSGYYFKDPAELSDHYLRTYGRDAGFDEQQAYWANKRIQEYDRIQREISEYKYRHRWGAQQQRIITNDLQDPIGSQISSSWFDAKRLRDLPGGTDVIAVIGDSTEAIKLYHGAIPNMKVRENLKAEIQSGKRQAFEIYNPEALPLNSMHESLGNVQIRYVVGSKVETKSLDWNHVPRRGGGHIIYDYEHYEKMPIVTTERVVRGKTSSIINRYKGDATYAGVENHAMGEELVRKKNEVVALMDAGKMDEAKALYVDTHALPEEWKDFSARFRPQKDPNTGVTHPPQLSTKERFYVVPKDKLIVDMIKGFEKKFEFTRSNGTVGTTFVDGTRSGSAARQFVTKFTGERDAYDLFHTVDKGTHGNPLYALEPGKVIDPLTAVNRSINRMINSSLMDDYKLSALEQWIREAQPLLKASEGELRYAPLHHFTAAGDSSAWKSALTPAENALKDRLLANRWKIQQLLGIPSTFDTTMHNVAQTLADWSYKGLGPKGSALVPHWLLHHVLDPVKVIRSLTFHGVMGLGAVWQFAVQQASYATMFAISPRYAILATHGNLLHIWSKFNRKPGMMETLDRYATMLHIPGVPQYKPGEWMESVKEGEQSGFFKVGGEVVNLDNLGTYRVIQSNGKKMLDAGLYPFKAAETNLRTGAWHIAFKEWRDAHPTGPVTNFDILKIIDRADLLYTNMTRASASYLQHGFPGLATQFLSFQMRLGEMFFTGSNRMGATLAERNWARARMYLTYATLFGATSATGVTGLPIGEWLRSKAIDTFGFVNGANAYSDIFMNGLPSFIISLATGRQYDIGDRYGAQGFEFIRNLYRGDKPWWTLTAATSKVFDVIQDFDPFIQTVQSWWRGDDPGFKIKGEHLIAPLKELAVFNASLKVLGAYNTQRWVSKNETYLGDTTTLRALFMAASGLQDQQINDAYLKGDIQKQEIELQKWGLKRSITEWRKGLQAVHDNNTAQADDYFANAVSYLITAGYPDAKFNGAVIAGDSAYYENLVDSTDFRMYIQHVTRDRIPMAEEIMKKIDQVKNKRDGVK